MTTGDVNFSDLFDGRMGQLNAERMRAFRRYCALNSDSGSYLDSLGQDQLRPFMRSVFEAVLKGYELDTVPQLSAEEKRYRKLLMQAFVNAANRSKKLRECADEFSETCLCAMLGLEWLYNETLASAISLSKPENGEMYYQLVRRMSCLWIRVCELINRIEGDENMEILPRYTGESQTREEALAEAYKARSWLLATFANYLEHNDNFLANCYRNLKPCVINNILVIADNLVEYCREGHSVTFAVGNVEYCLTLMENALKQFGAFKEIAESEDEEFSEKDTDIFIVRLCDILYIFLTLILNSDYNSVFFEKTTAAQLVLYVIEGILHYYYLKYREAAGPPTIKETIVFRPQFELSCRNAANVSCVRNLAKAFSAFRDADLIETMRLSCLELISSLCNKSDLNREYIGQNDGISLLLRCMYVRDGEDPTARLHSIAAMRHLVLGYSPNQQRLVQLAQEPSAVIDRDGLLKRLGLHAVYDHETKKIRLEPLSR